MGNLHIEVIDNPVGDPNIVGWAKSLGIGLVMPFLLLNARRLQHVGRKYLASGRKKIIVLEI